MQTVSYVCDSSYRNRIEYPLAGLFAIEPMVRVQVTAGTDNYSLAAPYDNGTMTIPAYAPAASVGVVQLVHTQAMPIDHFYMGHVLTLFGAGAQRVSVDVLDSVQANATTTLLSIDPPLAAPLVNPLASTQVYYWLTQGRPELTTTDVVVIDDLRVSLPKSVCNCHSGYEHAVIAYAPDPLTGYPVPSAVPFVAFVNALTSADPTLGCKRPREPPVPPDPNRCVLELNAALPAAVLAAPPGGVVVDFLVVNGVTNGNNVVNTRWVTAVQNMIFANRWPRPSGTPTNSFRVRLEQVLLPTAAPIRQMRSAADTQYTRDVDTQRYGGYITDFPYVIIELALNRQAEYHTVMVPSQAAVMGSFVAVVDAYRSPVKTFMIARCSTSLIIPTNVWEHILVTIRLPNGDILDFLPHPSMARRIPYAGADPLRQIQVIFVVDGIIKS